MRTQTININTITDSAYVRKSLFSDAQFNNLSDEVIRVAWNQNITYAGYDGKAFAFMGDTVLEMVVMHLFIKLFPQLTTAHDFTQLKSRLVKNASLMCLMDELHLCEILGLNFDKSCADTFEAFVGIIYYHLLNIQDAHPLVTIIVWLEEKWKFVTIMDFLIQYPNVEVCELLTQRIII